MPRKCSLCDRPVRVRGYCYRHYHEIVNGRFRTRQVGASDRERLEHYIERIPESGCWIWTGFLMENGYGHVLASGKIRRAHRVAYEAFVGPITPGLSVLHHCDVRCCINPYHLFVGTYAQNAADMIQKDRSNAGERHGMAKLTEEKALAIRSASGSSREVAALFGVSDSAVRLIRRRERWKHI